MEWREWLVSAAFVVTAFALFVVARRRREHAEEDRLEPGQAEILECLGEAGGELSDFQLKARLEEVAGNVSIPLGLIRSVTSSMQGVESFQARAGYTVYRLRPVSGDTEGTETEVA